jgi:GT2 family glycosyltransferase
MTQQDNPEAPTRRPRVVIVVVNWNGRTDTLVCLEALSALTYANARVLVVDNGSRDGSPELIEATYPEVILIRNGTNLGYTGGSNVGLRYAQAQGADYAWLLNNDALVTPNCLDILVRTAEEDPRLGLVGPIIYDEGRRDRIQFAGTWLDEERNVAAITTGGSRGVPVLVGTALLVKASVIAAVGYLDDRYFAYCEDWDYSLRALAAGFEVAVEPAARVFHKGAGSLGHDSPVREYYMVRNRYILWRSHLAGWSRHRYPARYLGWVLLRAWSNRSEGLTQLVPTVFDAAWDALRGRTGPLGRDPRMPWPLKSLLSVFLRWHPIFWAMLLRGEFRRIAFEAIRRTVRSLR